MSRLRTMLHHDRDSGLTLVELLVAMALMAVVVTVAMTAVVSSQDVVVTNKQLQDINEEARQALNRMARDIRQAETLVTAVNPDGPSFSGSGLVAVRFRADFDGDGCLAGTAPAAPAVTTAPVCNAYSAANPEDITYCFQPGVSQLFVIDNNVSGVTPVAAGQSACAGGQPLLAGNVSGFELAYRSDQYRYDLDPTDGRTTWRELDQALPPVGNGNDVLDSELSDIDSVALTITMKLGGRTQVYRTQVDLRNRSA